MSDLNNTVYFAQRAADERAKSKTASNERAAAAHREMAERYDAMATKAHGASPPLQLIVDGAGAHQ